MIGNMKYSQLCIALSMSSHVNEFLTHVLHLILICIHYLICICRIWTAPWRGCCRARETRTTSFRERFSRRSSCSPSTCPHRKSSLCSFNTAHSVHLNSYFHMWLVCFCITGVQSVSNAGKSFRLALSVERPQLRAYAFAS